MRLCEMNRPETIGQSVAAKRRRRLALRTLHKEIQKAHVISQDKSDFSSGILAMLHASMAYAAYRAVVTTTQNFGGRYE